MVATNDVRFISSEDFDAHEIQARSHSRWLLAGGSETSETLQPSAISAQYEDRDVRAVCRHPRKHCRTASKLLSVAACRPSRRVFLPQFPTGGHGAMKIIWSNAFSKEDWRAPRVLFPDQEVRAAPEYDERLMLN